MIDELDRTITAALDNIVSRTPNLGPAPSEIDHARARRPRRPLVLAIGAVMAVGVVGVVAATHRDSTTSTSGRVTDSTPEVSDPVGYVPAVLPDGYYLHEGFARTLEAGSHAFRVYGPTEGDPGASRAVAVETFSGVGRCGLEPVAIDVNGVPGTLCESTATEPAGLMFSIDDIGVWVYAGRNVASDELVQFARTLALKPRKVSGVRLTVVAEPSSLPEGWGLLVDRDALVLAGVTETLYYLAPRTDPAPTYNVTIWTDVPDSAVWAINHQIGAEPLTVRGHPAYIDERVDQNNPFLFWVERPGTVILVQNSGGDRATVTAFAEGLVGVDSAGLTAFLDQAVNKPVNRPTSAPATVRTTTRHFWNQVNLPAALGDTGHDDSVIAHANAVLTQQCMDEKGIAIDVFMPAILEKVTIDERYDREERRFAFDDRELIATLAYSWMVAPPSDEPIGRDDGDTESERAVGADLAACRVKADDELSVTGIAPGLAGQPIDAAQNSFVKEFRDDPAVAAAAQRWTDCMAVAGYDGADLFAKQLPDLTVVDEQTIARALADFDCRTSSGYRDAKIDYYTRRTAEWISENGDLIQTITGQTAAETARAEEVLAATSEESS